MFGLYVLLVPLFGASGALLYATPGQSVTVPCFYASEAKHICWYKQVAGEQPQIISSFYKHSPDSNSFHNQFKGNERFSVHTGAGFYHLNISNVQDSDSAMYYCGRTTIKITEFDDGTLLVLKESSRRSFLQQPASYSVKPGASVTLDCTVHAGTSDTELSVYWFKKENSTNPPLAVMYIHAHSSQCVHSLEPPAQSCVHSLSKTNVSQSDAGTYYCAVALCGEILFGNGTRLEVGGQKEDISPFLMHCSVAALFVSVVLNIILIGILCEKSRRKYLHSQEAISHLSVPEDTLNIQNEESDALQYATLDFEKRHSKSRRERRRQERGVTLSDPK
ncbi:sirpd [Pungitius sinensis]